jgi:hypothetical protein
VGSSSAVAIKLIFVEQGLVGWAYAFLPYRMDTLAVRAALAIVLRKVGAARLQVWGTGIFMLMTCSIVALCVLRHSVDRSDPAMAV